MVPRIQPSPAPLKLLHTITPPPLCENPASSGSVLCGPAPLPYNILLLIPFHLRKMWYLAHCSTLRPAICSNQCLNGPGIQHPIKHQIPSFLSFFFFLTFFFFWLCWVFVAAYGLSLVAPIGGYSSLRCAGFSLRWLLLLRSTGSRHAGSVVVARGLSSCGSRAQ